MGVACVQSAVLNYLPRLGLDDAQNLHDHLTYRRGMVKVYARACELAVEHRYVVRGWT